jgi:transglutaminase-like putative cysteine protease
MASERTAAADGTYLLWQRFRYAYPAPVRRLHHRLVVVPRAVHGHQRRLDHRVTVSGSPVLVSVSTDGFGNHVVEVRAAAVAADIEFEAWALMERDGPGGVTELSPAAVGDRRLLTATPLTRADLLLGDAARQLAAGGGGIGLAERACSWAHAALTYEYGTTGVHTTAAESVAGGRGVCQDYAHVMLALCRAAGLPARYVSGHLAGEGGSHAWVEAVVVDPSRPGRAMAVAFDPTHDRRARWGYLTVAVGRDYADVAPTSGTYEGVAGVVLSGRKRLALVGPDHSLPLAAASV